MEIGQSVSYIKQSIKDGIVEGTGRIKAYGLDPDSRVVYLVQDDIELDENANPISFHIFKECINPDDNKIEQFNEAIVAIGALETVANKKIQDITVEANNAIDEINNKLLGSPIDF